MPPYVGGKPLTYLVYRILLRCILFVEELTEDLNGL